MPPFLQVVKPRLGAGKTFVQGHRAPRGSRFKPSPPCLQTPWTLSCCLRMGPPYFNHPATYTSICFLTLRAHGSLRKAASRWRR